MFRKLALALLLLAPALAKSQNVDRIVTKIDNYFILRSEIESIVENNKKQGRTVNPCEALQYLALQKLLVAKAEIDSVIVDDGIIKDQLDARMESMVQQYGNERNIVEQFGKSLETLKSEMRKELKEMLTSQKMEETITEKVTVTPNEVKTFFNSFPKDQIPEIPVQVRLSQIVRLSPITPELRAELVSKLNDIKKRIENGADFGALAKEYSEDLGSKERGGELGWTKRGKMVPEFEAAAMNLDTMKLSEIVESDFGFHLIQTLEKRGQEYKSRHILLRPDYMILSTEKPRLYLDSLKDAIVKDTLDWNKMVKANSEDEMTKDAGGVIVDPQSGNDWHPIDQSMDASLYFIVNNMKVGDISKPSEHRTLDEKNGMRIIRVMAKKEAHKANLADDFEILKMYTLKNKQTETMEKWYADAIAEIYVKIDPEYESCKLFDIK